jgi:transcription antitermination factor NusG
MNWYCVHTKPKRESIVAEYCRTNLGLETYYPRLRQQKTIRRVRRVVTSPLFPRYFFCRFDPGVSYRAVRYAPDTIEVVQSGGEPTAVPESILAELQRWAGEGVDIFTIKRPLQPGDQVEIVDGPLQGLHAVVTHNAEDRDRVAVLLSLLQCSAPTTISRSNLRVRDLK